MFSTGRVPVSGFASPGACIDPFLYDRLEITWPNLSVDDQDDVIMSVTMVRRATPFTRMGFATPVILPVEAEPAHGITKCVVASIRPSRSSFSHMVNRANTVTVRNG
jgi:hypothetical protein